MKSKIKFVGAHLSVYFDGGKNCIGVIVYSPEGDLMDAVGEYNEDWCTNNEAEMAAALKAVDIIINR